MGQNFSALGPPPMTVGMTEDVFSRINSKRRPANNENKLTETARESETGIRLDPTPPNGTRRENPSETGTKLEIPVCKSSPCEPGRPPRSVGDLYTMESPKSHFAGPGSGRKSCLEFRDRSANEEHAFRESIEKVLEAERRRGFNDVEDFLSPLSDTAEQRKRKVCSEDFTQVMRCYQENSSRPLLCVKQTNALFNCFKDRAHSGGR